MRTIINLQSATLAVLTTLSCPVNAATDTSISIEINKPMAPPPFMFGNPYMNQWGPTIILRDRDTERRLDDLENSYERALHKAEKKKHSRIKELELQVASLKEDNERLRRALEEKPGYRVKKFKDAE